MKKKLKSVLNFLEILEDDDDVQYVYANLEIDNNFYQESFQLNDNYWCRSWNKWCN